MPALYTSDDENGKGPKPSRVAKLVAELEKGMPPGLSLARISMILTVGVVFMY